MMLLLPLAVWMSAAASPCDGRALMDGPLVVPMGFADGLTSHRTCPRTDVAIGSLLRADVDLAGYYADVHVDARVDAAVQVIPQLELSVAVQPLFYEAVFQSFRASHLGVGNSSVAATFLAFARNDFALSAFARASLPTAFGFYRNAFPVGLDGGLLLTVVPVPDVRLHGALLGHADGLITNADPRPHGAMFTNMGLDIVIYDWWSFVVDLDTVLLLTAPLERASLAGGTRLAFGRASAEVGLLVPFAGAERQDAALVLRVGYRL